MNALEAFAARCRGDNYQASNGLCMKSDHNTVEMANSALYAAEARFGTSPAIKAVKAMVG